jgi:hypothetical protein
MLNTIASLLVVLSVAGGVPATYGLAVAPGSCALCSPVHAVGDEVFHPGRLPAKQTASRDASRSTIAAAWRSLQLQPGLFAPGVATPAPAVSGAITRAANAPGASAATPSSPVRGPPSRI